MDSSIDKRIAELEAKIIPDNKVDGEIDEAENSLIRQTIQQYKNLNDNYTRQVQAIKDKL